MSTYEGNEYVVEQARTNVFKRLYDTKNYTGVYAERFRAGGDGRINGQTQVSLRATHAHFKGTLHYLHSLPSLLLPLLVLYLQYSFLLSYQVTRIRERMKLFMTFPS